MAGVERNQWTDEVVAQLVLPELSDVLGDGWGIDDEVGDEGAQPRRDDGLGWIDACLPTDFPESAVSATEEITFVGPDAYLYAVSLVMDGVPEAHQAWTGLVQEEFVRRFAAAIADDVAAGGEIELLGPVVEPADFTLERAGLRVAEHHAAFSSVSPDALQPILLRFAVVAAARTLVLLWSADRGDEVALPRWDRLIDRVSRRCEVALH